MLKIGNPAIILRNPTISGEYPAISTHERGDFGDGFNGKTLQWKIAILLVEKSTISMAMSNSYMLDYQKVYPYIP